MTGRPRWPRAAALVLAVLAGWIAFDLAGAGRHDLRQFDGHEVGRIETAMWRSYYDHRPLSLFGELSTLLRRQFHLPFWTSCLGAYDAARAAVVFQAGHERADYLRALPYLVRYYALIRRASVTPFDVNRVSALELEWWIVHRERAARSPDDLDRALAGLQAAIYGVPESRFSTHARARAEAMLIRDDRAEKGGVSADDWRRIGDLLDASWVSLHDAVQ